MTLSYDMTERHSVMSPAVFHSHALYFDAYQRNEEHWKGFQRHSLPVDSLGDVYRLELTAGQLRKATRLTATNNTLPHHSLLCRWRRDASI